MIIIVEGKASFGATPLEYIADMLRYDRGEVLYMLEEIDEPHFLAIIKATRNTEDRWRSFGLTVRESYRDFPMPTETVMYEDECADCGRAICDGGCN